MSTRFEQLDSLRGLASFGVLMHHFSLVLPSIGVFAAAPFFSGKEHVIFFFLLSGFVLFLPYHKGRPPQYTVFMLKRVFRIMVPYWVTLVSTIGLILALKPQPIETFSKWFNGAWNSGFDIGLLANHIALMGVYENHKLVPVIWSLSHEMRVSLVFPLIAYVVLKCSWQQTAVIGLLSSVAGLGLNMVLPREIGDYFSSLHYVAVFMAGALLARYREPLVNWMQSISRLKLMGLVAIASGLYFYGRLVKKVLPLEGTVWGFVNGTDFLQDWLNLLGAMPIMLAALALPVFIGFLKTKPLLWLGEISFSMYLYHTVVLLGMVHVLGKTLPFAVVYLLSLGVTLVVSQLSWVFVEKPAMAWGAKLSNRLFTRPVVVTENSPVV
jgi:peptidoglycan/LPS O-acetylase OafA/YrhL